MILLTNHENEKISVNPNYVTAIEESVPNEYNKLTTPIATLWVVGQSGYGTMSHSFKNYSIEELTDLINKAKIG